MEHRIDLLIAERAPWLYRDHSGSRTAKYFLRILFGYDATVEIAKSLEHASSTEIMDAMAKRLANSVSYNGLKHIPVHGPALIVANHPTGIADGIILHHLIAKTRPDAYFFANRDILRIFPQMETMIAPVEWRTDRRSHAKARQTLSYVRSATDAGRLGIIFPSGRLAKRRGLRLYERSWIASAATLARRFDLPIIPVNIQARNSSMFYLFDFIHPTLRDITLYH